MPKYFRVAAALLLGATILAVGFGFYTARNRSAFRLKSEHARLSNEVVAEVNGYERLETDGDIPKYLIKADRAITYSDNHQELENVFLQVYDQQAATSDKLTAAKALYVPEENKNFTIYMTGNVDIQTKDDLHATTEQITYTKANETADSDEAVEFSHNNVKGRAKGAQIKIAEKRLELISSVEIELYNSAGDVREGRVTSGSASFDQAAQMIEFRENVDGSFVNGDRTISVNSQRAEVHFASVDKSSPTLESVKMFDSVLIRSSQNGGKPTKIDAAFAKYDKLKDRFDLSGGVNIETVEGEQSTHASASEISYEEGSGRIALNGNAEASQADALVRGDHIDAELNSLRKLKKATARGNAYLKQVSSARTTEISSAELDATFDDNQVLTTASSTGQSTAVLTPATASDYTLVRLEVPDAIRVWFKGVGLIDRMQTDGRSTLQLNAANNDQNSANKKVMADSIRTFFDAEGKQIQKAEAIGNAELFVDPLRAAPENYKTKISAPRFDCDFFPGTNDARSCLAGVKARVVRTPSQSGGSEGEQNMSADKLTASFSAQSKDVDRLDAVGNAKFSQGDRNAIADRFSYAPSEAIIRMRGGEPTAWDSRARAKAGEIDWNTREQKSYLRGHVSTTYYSQKETGGATPFSDGNRPVFITADNAEFNHADQTGRYIGNARGWQENNFVRADSLFVDERGGSLRAEGKVQSSLYNVTRRENGKETNAPVFASSQRMTYGRDNRLVQYQDSVDIRQGTDRLTGSVASIYLNGNNEVTKSILEKNVVITQPNRRASGDYAEYTASDELVILRGSPATVNDSENGSSSAGELRMYMRDNRVTSEGKAKPNVAGRIRSVYKVKNNP